MTFRAVLHRFISAQFKGNRSAFAKAVEKEPNFISKVLAGQVKWDANELDQKLRKIGFRLIIEKENK